MTTKDDRHWQLLDESSKTNRNLAVVFLTYWAYLVLVAMSCEDVMIFMGQSQLKLPIIGLEVGIVPFYKLAPLFLVLIHFFVLFNLKAHILKMMGRNEAAERVFPFFINYAFFNSKGLEHWLLKLALIGIYGIGPLGAMAYLALAAAKFRDSELLWWHALYILLESFLFAYLVMDLLWRERYKSWGNLLDQLKNNWQKQVLAGASGLILLASFSMVGVWGAFAQKIEVVSGDFKVLEADSFAKQVGEWTSLYLRQGDVELWWGQNNPNIPKENRTYYLKGRNLRFIVLEGVDLSSANLQDVKLDHASLGFSKFNGANLDNASIQNSDLWGASFKNASLLMVNLNDSSFYKADFKGSSLEGAKMAQADFSFSDFEKANLSSSEVERSNFEKANFRGATFSYATMINNDLRYTEWRTAKIDNSSIRLNFLYGSIGLRELQNDAAEEADAMSEDNDWTTDEDADIRLDQTKGTL